MEEETQTTVAVSDGVDHFCSTCELTAAFNDDTMKVDHSQDCDHRDGKYFNRR